MDCLFCAIVAGDIPSKLVYEDELAVAFLDINPWQAGHTLVVPRRHVDDMLEDADVTASIVPAVQAVAQLLKDRLGAEGFNVLFNTGAVSGQEVFHLHAHVIPRYSAAPGIANLRSREPIDVDAVFAQLAG